MMGNFSNCSYGCFSAWVIQWVVKTYGPRVLFHMGQWLIGEFPSMYGSAKRIEILMEA
jgi:hypothetical protein